MGPWPWRFGCDWDRRARFSLEIFFLGHNPIPKLINTLHTLNSTAIKFLNASCSATLKFLNAPAAPAAAATSTSIPRKPLARRAYQPTGKHNRCNGI